MTTDHRCDRCSSRELCVSCCACVYHLLHSYHYAVMATGVMIVWLDISRGGLCSVRMTSWPFYKVLNNRTRNFQTKGEHAWAEWFIRIINRCYWPRFAKPCQTSIEHFQDAMSLFQDDIIRFLLVVIANERGTALDFPGTVHQSTLLTMHNIDRIRTS